MGKFSTMGSLLFASCLLILAFFCAGPRVIRRVRPDLQVTYSDIFPDWTMLDYMYHCNAQKAR